MLHDNDRILHANDLNLKILGWFPKIAYFPWSYTTLSDRTIVEKWVLLTLYWLRLVECDPFKLSIFETSSIDFINGNFRLILIRFFFFRFDSFFVGSFVWFGGFDSLNSRTLEILVKSAIFEWESLGEFSGSYWIKLTYVWHLKI